MDLINADRSLLVRTRLIAHTERIPRGDSFKATKRVCQMSMPGLTAIVGPGSPSAASHVQGMADQMHVPHIETRFDYSDHTLPYSINVHPHPAVLGKVSEFEFTSELALLAFLQFIYAPLILGSFGFFILHSFDIVLV